MIKQIMIGIIKFIMMATPFVSMVFMLLALWGVVGKITYGDLNLTQSETHSETEKAKNYMVSETKIIEQCPQNSENNTDIPLKNQIQAGKDNPMPKKIDWEHIV